MGSVGAPEILVIFLVALIVLGPDRLPKAAKQLGKAVSEFRRVTSGFQDEVKRAMDSSNEGDPSAPTTATRPEPSGAPGTPVDVANLPPPPDDPSRN